MGRVLPEAVGPAHDKPQSVLGLSRAASFTHIANSLMESVMETLLNQREAASVLRLSERTLERLRVQGGNAPKFVKLGREGA